MPCRARASSSISAISAAESAVGRQLDADPARIPSAIEAPSESTTWISRSGSMSRAIWALLIVPDRVPATWIETIASAPAGERRFVGVLELARRRGGGRRERRVGRDHPLPERLGRQLDAGLERLGAEVHEQRDDRDPLRRGVGRIQVRRGIGEDRDAAQGAPPRGWTAMTLRA